MPTPGPGSPSAGAGRGRAVPGSGGSARLLLAGALVAVASVALLLALGEIVLRAAGYRPPVLIDSSVKGTYDFSPGATFTYVGYRPGSPEEFRTPIRMNALGFRDRDYPAQRPRPGTFRVLVLGDSYVAAMEVGERQAFHKLLEERLNAADPLGRGSYEVIALGQGNRAQAAQLGWLREYGPRYTPDLVLLVFFCGNDVMENSRATFERARRYATFQLKVVAPRKLAFYRRLFRFRGSRLNGFVAERATALYASRMYLFHDDVTREQLQSPDAGVYDVPPRPEWLEAWRTTAGLLGQIRDESARQGATFALAVISGPQVIAEESQERLRRGGAGIDLQQPERWVVDWAAANGVSALSLGPALRAADPGKVFWRHDAHLTPFGHQVAADALYPYIVDLARPGPEKERRP